MESTLGTGAFGVEPWLIDQIRPYEQNARIITVAAVNKVSVLLEAYGWRQPIVVDVNGVIIAGHVRHQAALTLHKRGGTILNWPDTASAPVHVAEGLSPAAVKAYRLADNRSHEETSWDDDLLVRELASLRFENYDLALSGFDCHELDDLLDDFAPSSFAVADELGEPHDEPSSPSPSPSPCSAQVTIGEFKWKIPPKKYDAFLEGLRQKVGFDPSSIIAELQRRLGVA